MIDVSYICEVIFVVMGKFKFPKSSQFVFLMRVLCGSFRGMGEPKYMNAESVRLSVRYGFFLSAQVSLYTAKKTEGFRLVRNEACGKSTNLRQSIRAKRNFSVNYAMSCLSPPYVQGELVMVLKDAPYY